MVASLGAHAHRVAVVKNHTIKPWDIIVNDNWTEQTFVPCLLESLMVILPVLIEPKLYLDFLTVLKICLEL